MSEAGEIRTTAQTRRSWWPGWIWAMPIAAILVVGWLGVRALAQGGEHVVVSFDNAYGVKAGDTNVTYRGVKVGQVSSVSVSRDGRGVDVTLKLDRNMDHYLRRGTRFWLVGAKVDLADLSTLKALLSGPEIAMEPGPGEPSHRFRGQDQAPAIPTPTPGAAFTLVADTVGSLRAGSPIYYRGQEVGKIVSVRLAAPHRFEFGAFVSAPYDRLINSASRFWDASAVRISAKSSGVQAQLVSPEALLAGAVAFDTPNDAAAASGATGRQFFLYDSEDQAQGAPIGPQVAYVVRFNGSVGDLSKGAPVELRGFRVGTVTGFGLAYDAHSGVLDTPVQIELEPARLHIQGVQPPANGDWRGIVDTMLDRLTAQCLRARLAQDPPVVGGREIRLDFVPGAHPTGLVNRGGEEEIPSSSSGDIDSITAKADQILTKVDAIPIEQIGDNTRAITERVRSLVDSPKVTDSLNHLDSSLAQVDQTLHQVTPQIGPLVAKLRQTADDADSTVAAANRVIGGDPTSQDSDLPSALHEMTRTARSIRTLADYLERHPEALIKGKAKDKASQ